MDEIKLSCLQNNGYETPELNDKLYLHFRGFRRIENLDAYTGCKSIWLDSNGFTKIENLDNLRELRCLYLSKNLISSIEGLTNLSNLIILDLSYNHLTHLENLSCCKSLQTLNLSHNSLATPQSVAHLAECSSLTTIDLTNNRLESNEDFLSFFPKIANMVALSINGNEITKLPSFRKRMIALLPKLGYLDRPIEEQERLFAEAFVRGGNEAENVARQEWKEIQAQKRVDEMNEFKRWQAEQRNLRQQALAEGKSLIKEFTPEEQEMRRKEAEKAAQDEKDMLELGIDKIAAKYWALDSNRENERKDILDIATSQLRKQEDSKNVVLVKDSSQSFADNDIVRDGDSASTALSYLPPPPNVEEAVPQSHSSTLVPPPPPVIAADQPLAPKLSEEEIRLKENEKKLEEEIAQKEKERLLKEEKEAAEREQRVHESFAIYKRQLEERRKNPDDQISHVHVNTWHTATASFSVEDADEKLTTPILYWSEVMDLELAKQVKASVYDFDAVSSFMIDLAQKKRLDNLIVHRNPGLLTNETCRLRWAELDAANWSVPAPGVTAADTIFRINLTDEVLQHTGGAQPSYEALSRIAMSSKPNYLKVPSSFPSVSEALDDDLEALD